MTYQLIHGSAHDIPLPDKSVHSLCTSPPYFSFRRYAGEQEIDWHEMSYSPMAGLPEITIPAQRAALGLESDITSYIGHLILCLREWHRILRDDSCAFVNLGDSYAGSGGAHSFDHANPGLSNSTYRNGAERYKSDGGRGPSKGGNGLKPKDLMMIPARFALAAQADGWYLRSDIIWHKPNPMPESVSDRCTKAHEYIYMLAKSESYYFDQEAIRIPHSATSLSRYEYGHNAPDDPTGLVSAASKTGAFQSKRMGDHVNPNGANRRSVWTIATSPFPGAHFACWPEALVTPMIKASTSAHGVCPKCASPWRRVVERVGDAVNLEEGQRQRIRNNGVQNGGTQSVTLGVTHLIDRNTIGWQPTCNCQCDEVVPATVIDPFSGSGTTGKACLKLGRKYIGVDISEQYLTELAPERMSNVQMEMAL